MNLKFYKKCIDLKIRKKIYVAYSGGIDSSILLSLCHITFSNINYLIKVIHINHTINKKSNFWTYFCKKQCNALKLPIKIIKINNIKNKNLEENLRIERYKVMSKIITFKSTLLIGHQRHDLIETILLKLVRGAGMHGITSFKEKIKLGKLDIIRPLLKFNKNDLNQLSKRYNIYYVKDDSNENNEFSRNYMRNNIISMIEKKWKNFDKLILRFNTICKSMYKFINILLINNYFSYLDIKSNKLSINKIISLSKFIRYEIVKFWIKINNLKSPSLIHFKEIDKIMLSKNDVDSSLYLKHYKLIKFENNLYILKNKKIKCSFNITAKKNEISHIKKMYTLLIYTNEKEFYTYINLSNNIKRANNMNKINGVFQNNSNHLLINEPIYLYYKKTLIFILGIWKNKITILDKKIVLKLL